MNPIVSMNSSTGIPLSTVTFLNACSDMSCFAGGVCATAGAILSTQKAIVANAPAGARIAGATSLLFLVVTDAFEWPALPEFLLNGIHTVFFPHVSVGRAIRSFAPEALLDLL